MTEMMHEIAERVDAVTMPRSGHWVPEENQAFFADALVKFAFGGMRVHA
jgi:pimeloyl-ACP methyl ester carboxylesterase